MHRILLALCSFTACSAPTAQEPEADAEYARSMSQVCEVDKMAGLNPENNLIGIDGERHDWLIENVRHPDAIELITLLRVESAAKRAQMLREATKRADLRQCSLADFYEHAAADE